jgi:hypothetical protein
MNDFETQLTDGHPNSLGNTVAVVETILADRSRFDELYQCYFSDDEVVRLRVSSAMKRICYGHPEWLVPYLDKFINEIAKINQASTQWTLAQLFQWLQKDMSPSQLKSATTILKFNLEHSRDWIVQNNTMETLTMWSKNDADLKTWLKPKLEAFTKSHLKSVAARSKKMLALLDK